MHVTANLLARGMSRSVWRGRDVCKGLLDRDAGMPFARRSRVSTAESRLAGPYAVYAGRTAGRVNERLKAPCCDIWSVLQTSRTQMKS